MFKHQYGFDPTGGFGLAELMNIEPPALGEDFQRFWQQRHERILPLDTKPRLAPSPLQFDDWLCYDLSYTSTAEARISGWLLLPADGVVERGLVVGHGYAGRSAPEPHLPVSRCAVLFPCLRGLGRSRVAGLSSNPLFHVLHQIRDRQRYIIGACVDDLWLALSTLIALFPQVAGRVAYMGSSFGGGIGALAAPWDTRIQRLHLEVPTFGHQSLRLTLPCVGSGEAVRIFQRRHDFDVLDTLAYFDAAVAARLISIPTHVAVARFDPAVPPAGQFAIANALPPACRQLFVLDAGHFAYPGQARQEAALFAELTDFFADL